MSDPSLAERLVIAAVEALPYDPDDSTVPTYPPDSDAPVWVPVEVAARGAVVAVLRELAGTGYPYNLQLHALVDEIEWGLGDRIEGQS